jgi:hypothetical protein
VEIQHEEVHATAAQFLRGHAAHHLRHPVDHAHPSLQVLCEPPGGAIRALLFPVAQEHHDHQGPQSTQVWRRGTFCTINVIPVLVSATFSVRCGITKFMNVDVAFAGSVFSSVYQNQVTHSRHVSARTRRAPLLVSPGLLQVGASS